MVPRPFDDLNLELGDFENFIAVATPEEEQQESEQREQAETQEDVVEDGDDGKARTEDSLREQHLADGDTEEQVPKDKSSSSTSTNQKSDSNDGKSVPSLTSTSSVTNGLNGSLKNYNIMSTPFSGGHDGEDVVQWLQKFEESMEMLSQFLPVNKRLALLKLNLRGSAYNTVSANVKVGSGIDDKTAYKQAKKVLLDRYGPCSFAAWRELTTRRMKVGETPGEYLTELQRLASAAIPPSVRPDRTWVNATACLQYWNGIPQDLPGLAAIRAQWRELWQNRRDIVQGCLTLSEGFVVAKPPEDEAQHVSAIAYGYKGKGKAKGAKGKGKGFWYGKGKGLRYKTIGKGERSIRCFTCNGRGHRSAQCPSNVRNNKTTENVVIEGELCTQESRYLSVILRCDRPSKKSENKQFLAMIDTGSTISVVSETVASYIGDTTGISLIPQAQKKLKLTTLTGSVTAYQAVDSFEMRLCGVGVQPWIVNQESILSMGSTQIQALFGMDWLRACGQLTLKVNSMGSWIAGMVSGGDPVEQTRENQRVMKRKRSEETSVQHVDNVVLQNKDIILRRKKNDEDDSKYMWEVEWIWKQKPEDMVYRPPHYEEQMKKLTPHELELFHKSVQDMIDRKYFVKIPRCKVKGYITTMPVVSLGRTTPVRVVLDYTWLNSRIESMPNSSGEPINCQKMIRIWRTLDPNETLAIDIKHAYMMIRVKKEQTYYQCVRFPHLKGKDNMYVMTRAGFGCNISGKALDESLDYIIERIPTKRKVYKFVDDMVVNKKDFPIVKKELANNSFDIKPPKPLYGSTVLGIHINEDGTWSRGKPIADILEKIPQTKAELASYIGRLTPVYPVAGWLRVTAAMLTRISAVERSKNCENEDYPLNDEVKELWVSLAQVVKKEDPVKGVWSVNPVSKWELFTDSSSVALAAVLCFDGVVVEDRAWLRPKNCRRHINIAETEAALRGMELVVDYMKAYNIKKQEVHLRVDNVSLQHWLTRKQERKWQNIKGMSKVAIEGRLQLIDDIVEKFNITLNVSYVSSENNKADVPSRLHPRLSKKFIQTLRDIATKSEEDGQQVLAATRIENEEKERSEKLKLWLSEFQVHDKRISIPRDKAQELLTLTHDHEGKAAQFAKLKRWVDMPGLASECNLYKCQTCSMAKAFPNDKKPLVPLVSIKTAPRPWDRIHSDICGPYSQSGGSSRYYVITAKDSYSDYVVVRPCLNMPTSIDVRNFLQSIFDTFHRRPLVLHTDNGSQYKSKEIEAFLEKMNIVHLLNPVHASFCNGKIERWHRYLNEYLRAHIDTGNASTATFFNLANRACYQYNVTPQRRGESPHTNIFKFSPSMRPEVPIECHESYSYLQEIMKSPTKTQLKPGLNVLVRISGNVPKLQRRWTPAVVVQQLGDNRIQVKKSDDNIVIVHGYDIKLL